ncbi:branched-chain amino acid ABC transporter permease [Pseudahrensia aquimaris]|uniref:Branched-chain amino acid ABC transporter permease n=1 Tax=Pseudahrensia aquimaris TaxID=744461 RepID=A0ABW3FB71_9HYPH
MTLQGNSRAVFVFTIMAVLLLIVGYFQSWNVMLSILNLCIISAIMALGVNIQWGYAGLFNVGIMGFAALGGVAALLVSKPPVPTAWAAGGLGILGAGVLTAMVAAAIWFIVKRMRSGGTKNAVIFIVALGGYFLIRSVYDPAVNAIEADNPASSGYLGGLGLPIIFSWFVGGLFAAGIAWFIGKVALGLRSDYLAIATLGISEILIATMKNEDWLTRGVKNVTGLDRPVPYELQLQESEVFAGWVEWFFSSRLEGLTGDARTTVLRDAVIEGSSLFVKLCYTGLFTAVLLAVLALCVLALASPWGRMVRAIRDNEVSAAAMGKNVTRRHLQIFILGSAVVGIAGAMLTTLDGQFTPSTYQPLRYTFLIWVMVIVGGSGNNLGAVFGGFLIWFIWIEAEPVGNWFMGVVTQGMEDGSWLRTHLLDSAQHMRLIIMGAVMLLVMRFSPGGVLPERQQSQA